MKKKFSTDLFEFGDSLEDNFIHFTNIFRIVGIFFGITMIILPHMNEALLRDKVKYTLYSLLTIIFYVVEFINNSYNSDIRTWKFALLVFGISSIYISVLLGFTKSNYKDFFNKDSYGYFCLGKKFKDISLEQPLICPTNKLQ